MSSIQRAPADPARCHLHIAPVLRRPRTWTVLFAIPLAACAFSNGATTSTSQPESTLLIRVRNDNPLDARVYVVLESLDYRLGTVTSFRTATFRMPPLISGTAVTWRIKVVPIGGALEYVTEPMLTGPIDSIDLRLANPFAHSAIFVR